MFLAIKNVFRFDIEAFNILLEAGLDVDDCSLHRLLEDSLLYFLFLNFHFICTVEYISKMCIVSLQYLK